MVRWHRREYLDDEDDGEVRCSHCNGELVWTSLGFAGASPDINQVLQCMQCARPVVPTPEPIPDSCTSCGSLDVTHERRPMRNGREDWVPVCQRCGSEVVDAIDGRQHPEQHFADFPTAPEAFGEPRRRRPMGMNDVIAAQGIKRKSKPIPTKVNLPMDPRSYGGLS